MYSLCQGKRPRRTSVSHIPKLRCMPALRRVLRHHQQISARRSAVYGDGVGSAVILQASHIDPHIIVSRLAQHHSAGYGSLTALVSQRSPSAYLTEVSVPVSGLQTGKGTVFRLHRRKGFLHPRQHKLVKIAPVSILRRISLHGNINRVISCRQIQNAGFCALRIGIQQRNLRGTAAAFRHIKIAFRTVNIQTQKSLVSRKTGRIPLHQIPPVLRYGDRVIAPSPTAESDSPAAAPVRAVPAVASEIILSRPEVTCVGACVIVFRLHHNDIRGNRRPRVRSRQRHRGKYGIRRQTDYNKDCQRSFQDVFLFVSRLCLHLFFRLRSAFSPPAPRRSSRFLPPVPCEDRPLESLPSPS